MENQVRLDWPRGTTIAAASSLYDKILVLRYVVTEVIVEPERIQNRVAGNRANRNCPVYIPKRSFCQPRPKLGSNRDYSCAANILSLPLTLDRSPIGLRLQYHVGHATGSLALTINLRHAPMHFG